MKKRSPLTTTLIGTLSAIVIPVFWLLHASFSVTPLTHKHNPQFPFPNPWPPVLEQAYPDLDLMDQDGQTFKLSDLKGKIIIVEPVGMNCAACQAFSGAQYYGAFQNNPVQPELESLERMFPKYARGLKLPHPEIVVVQLLLYDMGMGRPNKTHAKIWAEHFKMEKSYNFFVAVSPLDLRGQASYDLIPGFQLIDQNFILRVDSTGHKPTHNLYTQLLPSVPVLLHHKPK